MKTVGVVLSGCGVYDGSEIYEPVIALLALDRAGAKVRCLAPDVEQLHVIDHRTGEVAEGETRNVLTEAARLARGEIEEISEVGPEELDALFLPGGFGAAKNLSTFAVDGPDCRVNDRVVRLVRGMLEAKKPVGAVCIAPAAVAKALEGSDFRPKLTLGTDEEMAGALETMGAAPESCPVTELTVDEELKIVSSPAYLLANRISEVADGIEKAVAKLLELADR